MFKKCIVVSDFYKYFGLIIEAGILVVGYISDRPEMTQSWQIFRQEVADRK